MISADGLAVEFGGTTLFSDISFVINEKDRIALMGKNGAGKSTLHVLRAENLLLVFLQFLGNIALGIGKGLLAYPLCRHLVLMRVAHLDVVAENIVVAYLQTGNLCQFALALLYLQQIILAGVGNPAQLVQLGTDTGFDDTSLINQ